MESSIVRLPSEKTPTSLPNLILNIIFGIRMQRSIQKYLEKEMKLGQNFSINIRKTVQVGDLGMKQVSKSTETRWTDCRVYVSTYAASNFAILNYCLGIYSVCMCDA